MVLLLVVVVNDVVVNDERPELAGRAQGRGPGLGPRWVLLCGRLRSP